MKWKIFCYSDAETDIISKEVGKFKNFNFNVCVHSLLQKDTQVLTSPFGKVVEL